MSTGEFHALQPRDREDDPGEPPTQEHQAPEITFDEQFYPARPKRFRPSARRSLRRRLADRLGGEDIADNREYVEWLVDQSMLHDANRLATQLSGQGSMWQNPFAHPDPRAAVERASVWFTAYPLSFVTARGESYLSALADCRLWDAFRRIGIEAVHTGPVKMAGGLNGRRLTPSIDGHFDRISMEVDPEFGTEEEFRLLCATAAEYEGTVIDDIVPGHTGKGADFRLAEMGHEDYPGIYHMVSINPDDWHLLPDVPDGRDSANLDAETEATLERCGYIIGRLQRVIFFEPGIKETNWSATRVVTGTDGVDRRWVYLHYFKEGQPSINWLDPSFSGMRLVIGDALHALADLGAGGLRLDANGFLGAEKSAEEEPAWSEGHPLSEAANHFIASMIRKMGGFSFQELNLSMDDIRKMGASGADLSYDFVNRPAYHHALVTGDTEFLRLTLNLAKEMGIDPASLVHAMQNHDELTHELVHFSTVHRDDCFPWHGEQVRGEELAEEVRQTLNTRLTGVRAPYNRTFTTNGIACTTATVIAATLGVRDLALITPEERDQIKHVHLLLVMFNALQPGVFALSGWDLAGMLTVDAANVADLIAEGDTRWLNRGGHDLRGVDDPATEGRMPPGRSLYGTLSEQLADPNSFASGLRRILEVRSKHGIATAKQLDVPEVANKAELIMVHELPDGLLQVTALNFSGEELGGSVRSEYLPGGARLTDMFTGEDLGTVDDLHTFSLAIEPYGGRSLLVTPE